MGEFGNSMISRIGYEITGEKRVITVKEKLLSLDKKAIVETKKLTHENKKLANASANTTNNEKKQSTVTDILNKELGEQAIRFMQIETQLKKYGEAMKHSKRILTTNSVAHKQLKARVKELSYEYTSMGGKTKKLLNHNSDLLSSFTRFRWLLVNFMLVFYAVKKTYDVVIKSSVELESEMANVQKTTNFSSKSIHNLRQELIEMSKTLPTTSKELGEIATVAGQLGLGKFGVGAVKGFTEAVAMMSIATEMSAEEAAKSLAKISQAYALPISAVNNLGSVINELSNTTAATSSEISNSLLRVGAAASNLGLSVGFVSALQSTLIDAGVRAERAGTRMISALNKITTNAAEFSEFVGMTFNEFAEILNDKPQEALMLILKTINDMESPLAKAAKTTELFGKVGGQNIMTLVASYEDLEENVNTANDEMKVGLSLLRETSIQVGTTANQWKILENRLIAYVSNTEGPVNSMLTNINGRFEASTLQVDKYGASFEGLKLGIRGAAGVIGAATATILGAGPWFTVAGFTAGAAIGDGMIAGIEKITGDDFEGLAPKAIEKMKSQLQSLYTPEQYAIVSKIIDSQKDLNSQYFIATRAMGLLSNEYVTLQSEQSRSLDSLSEENKLLGKGGESWTHLKSAINNISTEIETTGTITLEQMKRIQQFQWMIDKALSLEAPVIPDNYANLSAAKIELDAFRKAKQEAFDTRDLEKYQEASQELIYVEEDINRQFTNGVSIIDAFSKTVKDLTSEVNNFEQAYAKITMTDYAFEMFQLRNQYEEYSKLANEAADVTRDQVDLWYRNSRAISDYNKEMSDMNSEISDATDVLKDLQGELSNVNGEIKELSNAKFTGELGFQQKMSEYERYLKQIDFTEMTGMSAFEFINATMNMSNAQIKEFLGTFKDIKKETDTGKDSYEAWRDTVKAFISDTVEAGNELGTSVSDAVNKYSTLLLSTSRFESSTDSQSDSVGLLGDAYELHYGGMHDEVQDQIDLQNEQATTTYANAQQIIGALQTQWSEQERITESINNQQSAIDNLTTSLDSIQEEYDAMKAGMEGYTQSVSDAVAEMHKLVKAQQDVSNSSPTGNDNGNDNGNNNRTTNPFVDSSPGFQDLWDNLFPQTTSTKSNNKSNKTYSQDNPADNGYFPGINQYYRDIGKDKYGKDIPAMATGGIVTQPTMALIGEVGPEAVIPLDKMDSMGTKVTIGTINISGVNSSNPSDFAYKFAQELQRELRTI